MGYSSHLIGDAMTKQGIAPFHPIYKKSVKGFFRTGSWIELVIIAFIKLKIKWKPISEDKNKQNVVIN